MKTEREQIEEIATLFSNSCLWGKYDPNNCYECKHYFRENYTCNSYGHKEAEIIYSAGYRKASDVIDEFVERLKEENEISVRRYGKGIGISTIFRIADEMKQEFEK